VGPGTVRGTRQSSKIGNPSGFKDNSRRSQRSGDLRCAGKRCPHPGGCARFWESQVVNESQGLASLLDANSLRAFPGVSSQGSSTPGYCPQPCRVVATSRVGLATAQGDLAASGCEGYSAFHSWIPADQFGCNVTSSFNPEVVTGLKVTLLNWSFLMP